MLPGIIPKRFSTETAEIQDELNTVDEPPADDHDFTVLAASLGRGVAELLLDPMFHGWMKALRITGYMQGWKTKYSHNKHLIQNDLGIKIIISNAKAHSERGRGERRIRVLQETMEKLGVDSSSPMTCLQWDTLFSRISNTIDNLPIAKESNSNETALGYEIITHNRLKLGCNNYRSLEGSGVGLEMSSNS